jgi:hypothetical protein
MTTGIDRAARHESASLAHLGPHLSGVAGIAGTIGVGVGPCGLAGDLDQPVQRVGIGGRVGQVGFGQQVQRQLPVCVPN